MSIIISGLQNRVKNSSAYAEELGLMMIANGEEKPYILTVQGEKIDAGITPPAAAPTVIDNGAGTLSDNKYVVYAAVYVSENTFPSVGAKIYSNPSSFSATFHISTGGISRQNRISIAANANHFITHIYIYRTSLQNAATDAETAAAAGLMYFVGSVANTSGTRTVDDNTLDNIGNDPIQLINFVASQFRFVIWDGSYFWGFANHAFNAQAIWQLDGSFDLVNTSVDKFFGGRDDQYLTFQGVTSGGIDNRGTYLFKQTGDYTGQAVDLSGADLTLPSASTGSVVIIGPSATLYRSAYRNPFAWGYLQSIGGIYVPSIWELKVSGSLGTAIAIVPEQQLLKLDMEFPALCITYSLQTASTDVFNSTRRQVSKLYSVTSHFSQFVARAKDRQVLWGMDFKNLAIIQSDGYTQVPISGPISILLRQLSTNRSLHLQCHGIYDPQTEINCIWLSSDEIDNSASPLSFDLCIYQHASTGFWGIFSDYGILSSASIEDAVTSKRNIFVGTETGYLGRAFDPSTYGNWLPSNSIYTGFIRAATATSITRSEGQDDFDPTDLGLIGNFCIVVDANDLNPQLMKITGVTGDTLTFSNAFATTLVPTTTDDPGLVDGQWKFFIGLIELRVLKYFDEGQPAQDKAPREYWATASDAAYPIVEFYPEHAEEATNAIGLKQDSNLDTWFTKEGFPTSKGKTYGLAFVERSYLSTKLFNFSIK